MLKYFVAIALFVMLVYTRFVNLPWGLPYPFHPDERNMAVAIERLNCEEITNWKLEIGSFDCFNPEFFAYGQLPLYVSYFGIQIWHGLKGLNTPTTFEEGIIALRIISAASSVLTALLLAKIIQLLLPQLKISRGTKQA